MKECEVALRNREGPGPGYYNSAKAELKTLAGTEKDKFTIGFVSLLSSLTLVEYSRARAERGREVWGATAALIIQQRHQEGDQVAIKQLGHARGQDIGTHQGVRPSQK